MSKKKLFSVAVVVIMIAILSMSSLAWFSDSDSVKNDFMIADSDDDTADKIFSVDVWENNPSGKQGVGDEDITHVYKDVLPGDVLQKEAVVENTGYYDQYVRVTVTVSDAAAWKAIIGDGIWNLGNIVKVTDTYATDWYSDATLLEFDQDADTMVYTLYYCSILKGNHGTDGNGDEVTVFTDVKIPAKMDAAQAAAFKSNFSITVKAEAVQTENLGVNTTDNTVDAIQAFAAVEAP